MRSGDYGDEYDVNDDPTGMRARSGAAEGGIAGEDRYNRFSNAQLASWKRYESSDCPPNLPYRSIHDGGCVGKPMDRSRPGPGEGGGGGQGGGGGDQGGGGDYEAGGGWDNPVYDYLQSTAMDKEGWLNNYMGQGGATGFQQQIDEARAQANSIQDPIQRQAALARVETMLKPSLLTGLKTGAEQARMGLLSGSIMPQEFQNNTAWDASRQGWFKLNTDKQLGLSDLGLRRELGMGDLGLRRDLGMGDLGLRESELGFRTGPQFDWERKMDQDRLAQQKWQVQQGQPTSAQKWLGGIGEAAKVGKGIWDFGKEAKWWGAK